MKDESTVSQEIQIAAMYSGSNLQRNNSGAFYDGDERLVRYGLGNISKQHQANMASSDLIGITKVIITQEMVGQTLGVFTAIEVKKEGWRPKKLSAREVAQNNFISWVKGNGGIAGFAASVEQMKNILLRK